MKPFFLIFDNNSVSRHVKTVWEIYLFPPNLCCLYVFDGSNVLQNPDK